MHKNFRVAVVCCIALLGCSAAMGQDSKNRVRFGVYFASPQGDETFSEVDSFFNPISGRYERVTTSATLEADDATGGYVGYERMLGSLIGIDFNIMSANHDVNVSGTALFEEFDNQEFTPPPVSSMGVTVSNVKLGDLSVTPITVGINFHFLKGLDLYAGVFLSYNVVGDLTISNPFDPTDPGVDISFDASTGGGVNVGLDIPLGKRWAINVVGRYNQFAIEESDCVDCVDVDVDPLVLNAGATVKF